VALALAHRPGPHVRLCV